MFVRNARFLLNHGLSSAHRPRRTPLPRAGCGASAPRVGIPYRPRHRPGRRRLVQAVTYDPAVDLDVPARHGELGFSDVPPVRERASYLVRTFRATEEANRRAVLRMLGRYPGAAMLDLGTHTGSFTTRVAQRVGATEVHGVEFIAEHAARARRRGISVVQADLEDGIPFPDASMDVIHSNQVIEHLRHTDLFLSEIRRVLRPGGSAVISTNNLSSWHNVISLALGL